MDPNNPIVKLCAAGMQAEFTGRLDEARELFSQAWREHQDDFEACIAAHYLARHQVDHQQMLHWNTLALQYAQAAGDERVRGFYPSLYLNMGYSYEVLGELDQATRYYELAAARLSDLPEGSYGEVVRDAVQRGRERISGQANQDEKPISGRPDDHKDQSGSR
jgi:tetratricopeptide (TPR) repeat protein